VADAPPLKVYAYRLIGHYAAGMVGVAAHNPAQAKQLIANNPQFQALRDNQNQVPQLSGRATWSGVLANYAIPQILFLEWWTG